MAFFKIRAACTCSSQYLITPALRFSLEFSSTWNFHLLKFANSITPTQIICVRQCVHVQHCSLHASCRGRASPTRRKRKTVAGFWQFFSQRRCPSILTQHHGVSSPMLVPVSFSFPWLARGLCRSWYYAESNCFYASYLASDPTTWPEEATMK